MPRECNCAGPCGPQGYDEEASAVDADASAGQTRREFITLAVGAGAVLAGRQALAAEEEKTKQATEELARWKRDLRKPGTPRRYLSDVHRDVRFPLGGIGTGNFELGADGQFTTWQLFNTLRDGYVPFFLGVRAGKTAKMLQTVGGPDLPRVRQIEMTGEYPLAVLRFRDADLPVEIGMTAFTPFAPLDTHLSSLPVAAFVFRVHNPTKVKQTVSLGAFLQNPVGYDAFGSPISFNSVGFNTVEQRLAPEHPNFGGNVNEPFRENGATGLLLRAEPGRAPTLDKPLHLYTNASPGGLNALPIDRPANLTVEGVEALANRTDWADAERAVIWLEAAPADLPEPVLAAARNAVRAGATLVFAGEDAPLLRTYAEATGGKPITPTSLSPDILFEDFESGYDGWAVEGDAFGTGPAAGTQPNQNPVTGFAGKGLVNSYPGSDDATGQMISRSFPIERRFIRFLVGGGRHPTTQIRLVADGKVVRAQSGRDDERLAPALWDVSDLRGQTAHIEIVDEQKGPWGHVNVDQIEFTDLPAARAVLELLDDLLPARFRDVRTGPIFDGLTPREGATETPARGGSPRRIARPVGKGRVILAMGPILNPAQAELIGARQRAYALLAELAGSEYTAPNGVPPAAPGFGTLALATTGPNATDLPDFADWKTAWEIFARDGRFPQVDRAKTAGPTPPGRTRNGALASTVTVAPGETVEVPFFLAWRYPNKYSGAGVLMGNHYATLWPDARAVVRDVAAHFPESRAQTERFHKTFYDSTLPYGLLDCLTSQISTIRHVGVVFRIANGDIYGWEGSNGCCQPTCTHVWGYEQSLARLFPDLERDMRRIDFFHQQRPDGGVNNRTEVPSPPRPTGEQPFTDGHASCILKAYREALNHPDDTWLRKYWPNLRRAVEYLIARDAATSGGAPDGTLSDDQWNTYDNAIHGVNSFIGTYYLAALRAGEEMARRMGENDVATRFHAVFQKGQKRLIELCWNGEYFQQHLPDYLQRSGEYGPGCMSDQIIGQWWAHQLGLGYLLPREQVRSALRAVFQHNWLTDHTNWRHYWRKFAGGKDKGLLVCTWPKGGRPANTIPYVDEVWTGLEYQVAGHLLYEGMTDEALAIVQGARARYDGVPRPPIPRNPWNEIECGGHYARALSSWSLLLALSGYEYDGPAKRLRFTPRLTPANFKACFTGPEGWGSLAQTRRGKMQRNEIRVEAGRFPVAALHLDAPNATGASVRVTVNGKRVPATIRAAQDGLHVALSRPVSLNAGEALTITIGSA